MCMTYNICNKLASWRWRVVMFWEVELLCPNWRGCDGASVREWLMSHLTTQGFIQGGGNQGFPPPPPQIQFSPPPPRILKLIKWIISAIKYKYDANNCSSSWTKVLALCFHGKAFIRNGGLGRGFIWLVQANYRSTCINGTRKNHSCSQRNDTRARSGMTLQHYKSYAYM